MALHFEFENGSNPYIFFGTDTECENEKKRWSKNWNLFFIGKSNGNEFFRLSEKEKYTYEIRQIDALYDCESWYWNTSCNLGAFTTHANDHKRAFLNALHNLGIVCKRGACYVDYDGSIYELRRRGTHEPLFAAIPLNH